MTLNVNRKPAASLPPLSSSVARSENVVSPVCPIIFEQLARLIGFQHFTVISPFVIETQTMVHYGPKLHLFSRDSGKTAVQGPPKLPEGLELPEGSFGGPRMAVFNQSPEEKGGVLSLYTGFARFPRVAIIK